MKYVIASDIHGSFLCCEQLLDSFRRENADRLILLGDLLYHWKRFTRAEGFDAEETAELLNGFRDRILCIPAETAIRNRISGCSPSPCSPNTVFLRYADKP